jgi:hypothetical protein
LYLQGMVRVPRIPYLTASYTTSDSKNERNAEITSVDSTLYNPYTRKSNMISVGVGYEFEMLPIAPTTLDVGWRSGSDNQDSPDSLYVYDSETENISISLISRFIDFPLKTQVAISNNTQERKTDGIKNTNLNFQLKGEYRLFDNMVIPWAEYRTTQLGGDQNQQVYNYVTLGADARPLDSTTISTSLGWQIYGNKDLPNVDYSTTAWRLTVSYRF